MLRTMILVAATLAACQSDPQPAPSEAQPAPPDDESVQTMAEIDMQTMSAALLAQAVGSYSGPNLLWFQDPNKPHESEGEVEVEADRIRYTWSYEDKPQSGDMTFSFSPDGVEVEWNDTWHTPEPMQFKGDHVADAIIVRGTYGAGEGPDWGWRIELRAPRRGEFLIEMFNIHPDGQEDAAVRLHSERR